MSYLTQILRSVFGRQLGLDANDNLVIGGAKIYFNHDSGAEGVLDLAGGTGSGPVWVKIGAALTFAQFAAAAQANTINIGPLAQGQVVHGIKIKHSTSFAGGGIATYTVSVGVAGNNAKYAGAFDVFQAVGLRAYQLSSNFGGEDGLTNFTATAISTGANLNAATQGQVDIWALLSSAT